MSKSEIDFCDCCGGILYHSLSSLKLTSKSLKRLWWWNGSFRVNGAYDLCSDCFHAIRVVLEKRREKVAKIKLAARNKSPYDLMQARKPISEQEAKKLL